MEAHTLHDAELLLLLLLLGVLYNGHKTMVVVYYYCYRYMAIMQRITSSELEQSFTVKSKSGEY